MHTMQKTYTKTPGRLTVIRVLDVHNISSDNISYISYDELVDQVLYRMWDLQRGLDRDVQERNVDAWLTERGTHDPRVLVESWEQQQTVILHGPNTQSASYRPTDTVPRTCPVIRWRLIPCRSWQQA